MFYHIFTPCSCISFDDKMKKNSLYRMAHLVIDSDVLYRCGDAFLVSEGQRSRLLSFLAVEVQMATGTNERLNGQLERWGCNEEAAE